MTLLFYYRLFYIILFIIISNLITLISYAQPISIPPTDIEELTAEAGDESITLEWKASTDHDGEIIHYKIYFGEQSVSTAKQTYTKVRKTSSNSTIYTIENLQNNLKYYFAVTAVDDTFEESINYSPEAWQIPQSKAELYKEYPQILQAVHFSPNEILIRMSEEVSYTGDPNKSFFLQDQESYNKITIWEVKINGKNILIKFPKSDIQKNKLYKIQATSNIKNKSGKSVVFDFGDSFIFEGRQIFTPEGPLITRCPGSPNCPKNLCTLNPNAPGCFAIFCKNNPKAKECILDICLQNETASGCPNDPCVLDSNNFGCSSYLMEMNYENYHEVPEMNSSINDSVVEEEIPETNSLINTSPLDVNNIKIDASKLSSKNESVIISWDLPLDVKNNIITQAISLRREGGDFLPEVPLDKNVNQIVMDVFLQQYYQVKIVTIDKDGNRSLGSMTNFSTFLEQAGSAFWLMGSIVSVLIISYIFIIRRRFF